MFGSLFPRGRVYDSSSAEPAGTGSLLIGSISRLEDTPVVKTSHASIVKHQLFQAFLVQHLSGISVATLQNQVVETHHHKSMHEFFFILKGKGTIQVNGVNHTATQDLFLHVAPGEEHSIWTDSGELLSSRRNIYISLIAYF
jgi:quercetin dioxygenase-like cupin family protein